MSDHQSRRDVRTRARRWMWVKRTFSLIVVAVVGLAVWAGAHRAEQADARAAHQDCLNQAYQVSLNQRAQATDQLIDAILATNTKLVNDAGDTSAQSRDRRDFADQVALVKSTRAQAAQQTTQAQGASCG